MGTAAGTEREIDKRLTASRFPHPLLTVPRLLMGEAMNEKSERPLGEPRQGGEHFDIPSSVTCSGSLFGKTDKLRRVIKTMRWWGVFLPIFVTNGYTTAAGLPDTFRLADNPFLGAILVLATFISLAVQAFDALPRTMDGLISVCRTTVALLSRTVGALERLGTWMYAVFGDDAESSSKR